MPTESFLLDEGNGSITISLLQTIFTQDNMFLKLNQMDTCLSALDEKLVKETNAHIFKKWLNEKFLKDTNFIRQLKIYSKINENTETALEYFGQDFISHPEFAFDKDFEKKLAYLNKQINHFTGKLLKELTKGETLEF